MRLYVVSVVLTKATPIGVNIANFLTYRHRDCEAAARGSAVDDAMVANPEHQVYMVQSAEIPTPIGVSDQGRTPAAPKA